MNSREEDALQLKPLLVPTSDDTLVLSPASTLVNSVNNDAPELVVPDQASRSIGGVFSGTLPYHCRRPE